MDATLLAARAVATQYARGVLWLVLCLGLGAYALLMLLIGWIAASASNWWWLLATVPTCLIVIGVGVWVAVFTLLKRATPPMNAKRRAATKKVIERINHVAEQFGTPKFVILYRVVKDVLAPPGAARRTYIGELASEPGELKRAFDELRHLF